MFSLCFLALNSDVAFAEEDTTSYFYIKQSTLSKTAESSEIYFRNTSGDELFAIPQSFYVKITGEASGGSYPAEYLGIAGTIAQVDESKITKPDKTVYSNTTINDSNAYPTLSNIELTPISDTFTVDDIQYSKNQASVYILGKTLDSSKIYVMVKMGGNTYTGKAATTQFNTKTIQANDEVINYIDAQENGNNSNQPNTNNSKALRVILIIGLIIPAVIIALLIFIPKKSEQYDKARMNSKKVGNIDYDKTRMPNNGQPYQDGYNQYPPQQNGYQQPQYPQYQQPQYPPQNNGYYPPQQNGYYPPQDNGYYPPQQNGYYNPNDPNGGMQ